MKAFYCIILSTL